MASVGVEHSIQERVRGFRLEFYYLEPDEPEIAKGTAEAALCAIVEEARVKIGNTIDRLIAAGIQVVMCQKDGRPIGESF